MKKTLLPLFILFVLILSSCQNNDIEITHKFEDHKWNAFKKIKLESRIADKEHPYKMILDIKIDDNYNANNFAIGISQTNDDGESRYSTFELPIKDKFGEIIDPKSDDSLYHYTMILNKKTYFNSDSTYYFTFENMMNKFYLEGIHEMELRLEQLK